VNKTFEKNKFCQKCPAFLEKKNQKNYLKNCQNHLKYEKGAQDFRLSYFEYHQIWLNLLMDDCHLSNITPKKKV
jgi:hypothetical protein